MGSGRRRVDRVPVDREALDRELQILERTPRGTGSAGRVTSITSMNPSMSRYRNPPPRYARPPDTATVDALLVDQIVLSTSGMGRLGDVHHGEARTRRCRSRPRRRRPASRKARPTLAPPANVQLPITTGESGSARS